MIYLKMNQYQTHNKYVDQTRHSWTSQSTKLLLENLHKHKTTIHDKNQLQKKFWDEIAADLVNKGYLVNWEQFSTKWRNLKKKYKHIKDNSNRTGAGSRENWEHFEIIDEIMYTMPEK
ncbi:uncharacterized protein [Prorops nasuta]|uniref:uncharacterized protein isoform X2 n=1 Tax=Prorops nasuta TaxID=863751 RepID=UPI0034CFCDD3